MKSSEKLPEKLRVGDEIYYANTYQRVTPQMLLFINKGMYKGTYEAIEITTKVAERFKFTPNATKTMWELKFSDREIVNLYFQDCKNLSKVRIRNITDMDILKWDFKPMQLHELQQITDILLNKEYYD